MLVDGSPAARTFPTTVLCGLGLPHQGESGQLRDARMPAADTSPRLIGAQHCPYAHSTCVWDSNSVTVRNRLSSQGFDAAVAVGRVAESSEDSIPNSRNALDLARSWWEEGLAERVGFEPTVEFPLHTLSKRAPSTTRTSLRVFRIKHLPRYRWRRKRDCAPDCALTPL
jgi:hypothetical protein